jgi:hypothetical protein
MHTEVQLVDPTLLARWHCLSISTPAAPDPISPPLSPGLPPDVLTRSSSSTRFAVPHVPFGLSTRHQQPSTPDELPLSFTKTGRLFLAFATSAELNTFYATLQCFTRSPGPLASLWPLYAPPSPRKAEDGCTMRTWRGLELQIVEGRGLGIVQHDSYLPKSVSASTTNLLDHTVGMVRSASSRATPTLSSAPERPMSAQGEASGGTFRQAAAASKAAAATEVFCEVVVGDEVVGRTASKKSGQTSFWREHFTLQ